MARSLTAPSAWLQFTWNARSLITLDEHVKRLKMDPEDTLAVQKLWQDLQQDATDSLKFINAEIADLCRQLVQLRKRRDLVRDFIVG